MCVLIDRDVLKRWEAYLLPSWHVRYARGGLGCLRKPVDVSNRLDRVHKKYLPCGAELDNQVQTNSFCGSTQSLPLPLLQSHLFFTQPGAAGPRLMDGTTTSFSFPLTSWTQRLHGACHAFSAAVLNDSELEWTHTTRLCSSAP